MKKLKNKIKKVIFISFTSIMLLVLNFLGVTNSIYAAELKESVKLENLGDCGSLLKYKGTEVTTTFVAYKDGSKIYPAYCLNVNLPGVGEKGSYTVSTKNLVSDVGLWRRIINGYPYKTIKELGCKTKEEAFTATKHAVYCYIHNVNPNDYKAIGTAGKRTLKAMKQIIENAQNSKETKIETTVKINKDLSKWNVDNKDNNYISKLYEVKSNADFKNYSITIEKEGKENQPEGWKLTNENNEEKTKFNKGEKFKVLIPIKDLTTSGSFTLSAKTELNTKPVLYGKAPNSNLQDYAITTLQYEEGVAKTKEKYNENKTKITIFKQEKNTQKPLQGVTFNLLNQNKEIVNSALTTDIDGKIVLSGIMPGKYYLRETSTLDGYVKYDEDIEINVDLNEEFKVTVYNSKESKVEVEKSIKEVIVSNDLKQSEINENVETKEINKTENVEKINKNESASKIDETNDIKEIEENIEKVDKTQNKTKSITKIEEKSEESKIENKVEKQNVVKKLPVTGM